MTKQLWFCTLLAIAMHTTVSAQDEAALDQRVRRLESKLVDVTKSLDVIARMLSMRRGLPAAPEATAVAQTAPASEPVADKPKARPKPGAVPLPQSAEPSGSDRETTPDSAALGVAKRPKPAAVKAATKTTQPEKEVESTPATRRLMPSSQASNDELSRWITKLDKRVEDLIEVARQRQQEHAKRGIAPRHKTQLLKLESHVDALEELLKQE